jgi:CheY-like chemotaxis protein
VPAPAGKASMRMGESCRVLIVEDNADTLESLRLQMELWGNEVSTARTAEEALEKATAARPQIVLCDIGLPGMDGVEVCRRIRALELKPSPVMVALTGWGMEEDRRRTGEAGFEHHLVKPVAPDQLRAILKAVGDTLRARADQRVA